MTKVNAKISELMDFSKLTPQIPGMLRSDTSLTLHTHYALAFVTGRARQESQQRNAIPGLLAFAKRTRLLWQSTQADDPYADWQLLIIEQDLEAATRLIGNWHQQLSDSLTMHHTLSWTNAQSIQPTIIRLQFHNPYGYLAAACVGEYDQLACRILLGIHVGLLTKQSGFQTLNQTGRCLRRLFSQVYTWKRTGVTRTDIDHNTQRAQQAIARLGDCPIDILEKRHRGIYAPEIRTINHQTAC
ncbi:MAG: TIGR03761 family integrating conjugative element protein [Gammaproteobacteria bacterium]|nr:TIGR03761 family integrating conjugative element protein [Gammaproteobacteria bacterium]